MRIGIIGTINRDSINLPDGRHKEGWGGILYNIVALSSLIGRKADIVPVCNVGQDCHKRIMSILRPLTGVVTDFVKKVPEKNNHCFLTYSDSENKREILKGGVRRLVYDDVRPLLNCDIILLNYISGRDIHIRSLQKLRREFPGQIYVDIHSLTLGKRKDGVRFLRVPQGWTKVARACDYVQLNRSELALLTGEEKADRNDNISPRFAVESLESLLMQAGADLPRRVFIVTDGRRGCYLCQYRSGRIGFQHIPPRRIVIRGDATGCGDCFSAGFVFGLVRRKSLHTCAVYGNDAALSRILSQTGTYSVLERP
ncbi:MAG: carbohydrate kinase family protein [Candidatus Zixiibacteriota bacterium]|nr:MAG: carbohydrate kinase family protein [candidate division Zixibacteria bacterium]